jgi:DNA repair protein REV1
MMRRVVLWKVLISGEEYGESSFGGFGDYMRRKKLKLQNQDEEIRKDITDEPQLFKGMVIHVGSMATC